MNRPRLERSIRSPMGLFLAAMVAATIVANSATSTAALAQQPRPVDQLRDEAPIGHRQPRIQDLPPGVARDENKIATQENALYNTLENSASAGRWCAVAPCSMH
jgi:hypothetical protein